MCGGLEAAVIRACWQSALRRCFWQKIPVCRVKNARKVSNLAALFSLHSGIFYAKNCSQAEGQYSLVAAEFVIVAAF